MTSLEDLIKQGLVYDTSHDRSGVWFGWIDVYNKQHLKVWLTASYVGWDEARDGPKAEHLRVDGHTPLYFLSKPFLARERWEATEILTQLIDKELQETNRTIVQSDRLPVRNRAQFKIVSLNEASFNRFSDLDL